MAGLSVLRKLFNVDKHPQDVRRPQVKTDDTYQNIADNQPHNPYTEACLLQGHSTCVRQLTTIDSKRFVTVSDDHLVIVWDAETGCRLQTLVGHTAPVTCALSLRLSSEKGLLMTGSRDSSLRLWDLSCEEMAVQEGPCVKTITHHGGSIECLTQLNHNLICSGGRDLCIWDRNGILLDKFDRSNLQETSDVHSVLRLDTAHLGVISASNYKCLAVYDIEKPPLTDKGYYRFKKDQKRRYLTQSHNCPITFLTTISATFFASGSGDGMIIVWSVQHLSAMKIFHCLLQPLKELSTTEFCKVSCIQVVSERYVFAAVGCGFSMYDVLGQEKDSHGHPKPLVSHTCAHLLPLTSLLFLEDRSMLLTVAEDKMVRLWGSANRQRREGESSCQPTQGKFAIENFIGVSRTKGPTIVPLLMGELHLHAGAIKLLASLGEHGIVTGGDDGSVILWKDGEKEQERRDQLMQSLLMRPQSQSPELLT